MERENHTSRKMVFFYACAENGTSSDLRSWVFNGGGGGDIGRRIGRRVSE
jgi:hypothetical protein